MGLLKDDLGEMLKQGFLGDDFIVAFLDSSGIRKKKNYEKEIAENMKKIAQNLDRSL